jgi:hypothetical protein
MLAAAAVGRGFYEYRYRSSASQIPALFRSTGALWALFGVWCVVDAIYYVFSGHPAWPF